MVRLYLKKMFVLCCAIALCATTSAAAFAQQVDTKQQNTSSIPTTIVQDNKDLHINYVPCPGGGKHSMTGRGRGLAYRGASPSNDLVINGTCSQCTKCGEFFISQYNPFYAGATCLGTYAMGQVNYTLASATVLYTNDFYYNDSFAGDPFFLSYEWYRPY